MNNNKIKLKSRLFTKQCLWRSVLKRGRIYIRLSPFSKGSLISVVEAVHEGDRYYQQLCYAI